MRMGLLAIVTTGVIVNATICASLGVPVFGFVRYIPGRDITAHFLLFAALGLSVSGWLRQSRRRALADNWLWFVTALVGLTTLDEFSQMLIPARSFSLLDLAASLGGLLIGALMSAWLGPSRGDEAVAKPIQAPDPDARRE